MADTPSFGGWLRQKRKTLDLTRHELAQRASCAVVTIEKIETNQRRPSRQVAEALATALGIPDEERAAYMAFARGHAAALGIAAAPALLRNNLPSVLPPLIGRDDVLGAILHALARPSGKVVGLIGPGGVGKTLLALHAAQSCAREVNAEHASATTALAAVVFVDLAPIRQPAQVMPAIAQSLAAVFEQERVRVSFDAVCEQLRDHPALLVLDNFEQVSDAAPLVAKLVAACPTARVLVTSRVGLHASGGREIVIAPMESAPAASLFIARARQSAPQFAPTPDDLLAIDTLCRKLDGLPLAIELVAARVKLMTPTKLLARLLPANARLQLDLVADGLSDLPDRQRTMRNTIAWSYQLLSPLEQAVFRAMSVFAGGCDLAAAEAVVGIHIAQPTSDAIVTHWNALTSLMNNSLLKEDITHDGFDDFDGGEPRFAMLETVREYAAERLAADEAAVIAQRHADYFLAFAREAEPQAGCPLPARWLHRVSSEQANLRAALQWHMVHDAPSALDLCVALGAYWHTSGVWTEGRQCLTAALSAVGDDAPLAARAGAHYWLGRLDRKLNDWAGALHHARESVALFRSSGDGRTLAMAIMALGWAAYSQLGHTEAARHFEEGLAIYRQLEDERGIAQALLDLAHIITERDADYTHATRLLHESRTLFRHLGDDEGLALVSSGLGNIASLRGDYAESRRWLLEGLAGYTRVGAKGFVAAQHLEIGEVSYFLGDMATAEQEWQLSLDMHRAISSTGGVARTLFHLARLRRIEGKLPDAMAFLVEALGTFRQTARMHMVARCVAAIGGIALMRGQRAQSATLLSAAQHYFDSVPPFLAPADIVEYDRDIADCRAQLGSAAFAAAWAAGRAMTLAHACELALAL